MFVGVCGWSDAWQQRHQRKGNVSLVWLSDSAASETFNMNTQQKGFESDYFFLLTFSEEFGALEIVGGV